MYLKVLQLIFDLIFLINFEVLLAQNQAGLGICIVNYPHLLHVHIIALGAKCAFYRLFIVPSL